MFPGLVLLLTFGAFGRSLVQGFAPIDDSYLIVGNLAVRGVTFENLRTIFTTFDPELYIPLTLFSFQLNYLASELAPWSYHLGNLLLHAANALLVGSVLEKLTKQRTLSLFGGILFALHPLHTEAVVWIAGRKDLLSTFFFLLSFLCYISWIDGQRKVVNGKRKWAWYFSSLLCFLCALLSKVNTVTLPVILLLTDVLVLRRRDVRRMLLEKVPYVFFALVFMGIATLGKERVLASSTILETLLMAARSTVFYLQKFFFPFGLTVFYPHQGPIGIADPRFFIPLLLVLLLVGCALRSLWKKRTFAFGFLAYLTILSPTFLNFHKGDAMFFGVDRYAYLPSVGILLLLIVGMTWILERWRSIPFWIPCGMGVSIVILFTLLSFHQTRFWDSPETLFRHALALYPESVPARTDLARMLREQGRTTDAFTLLKEGLRYGDNGHLHLAAGYIYAKVGQVHEAEEQFRVALDMLPMNPEPVFSLGSLKEQTGDSRAAEELFTKAIKMDPSYVGARVRLGRILLARGMRDEARREFQEALGWNRSSRGALLGLADIIEIEGDSEQAALYRSKVTSLDPAFP